MLLETERTCCLTTVICSAHFRLFIYRFFRDSLPATNEWPCWIHPTAVYVYRRNKSFTQTSRLALRVKCSFLVGIGEKATRKLWKEGEHRFQSLYSWWKKNWRVFEFKTNFFNTTSDVEHSQTNTYYVTEPPCHLKKVVVTLIAV